jgi:hypothetical protein
MPKSTSHSFPFRRATQESRSYHAQSRTCSDLAPRARRYIGSLYQPPPVLWPRIIVNPSSLVRQAALHSIRAWVAGFRLKSTKLEYLNGFIVIRINIQVQPLPDLQQDFCLDKSIHVFGHLQFVDGRDNRATTDIGHTIRWVCFMLLILILFLMLLLVP